MKSIVNIGVNDPEVSLFEGQYRVKNGMAYNSYVIKGEKVAVLDTVDIHCTEKWFAGLEKALDGRKPDFLIVQHMEPDHSANIAAFAEKYPETKIVASAQAFKMMSGYFGTDYPDRKIAVADGAELDLGDRKLKFVGAAMVHWPEVIMTYDPAEKVLFTADGFGKFGVSDADEPWEQEAARYYFGIVGKYGAQVQAVLKKAAALEVETVCPLHGPVLTGSAVGEALRLYDVWSSYKPEFGDLCTVCYSSIYGNTAKAALDIAEKLEAEGVKTAKFDLNRCDLHEAVASAFRGSAVVLCSSTYNADVFPTMREFINKLVERGFKDRTVGLCEGGSWAPASAKVMKGMLEGCKDLRFAETVVKVKCAPDAETRAQSQNLAKEIKAAI